MSARRLGLAVVVALVGATGSAVALGKERRCIDPKTRVATDLCPPEAAPTPASAAEAQEALRPAIVAKYADLSSRLRGAWPPR